METRFVKLSRRTVNLAHVTQAVDEVETWADGSHAKIVLKVDYTNGKSATLSGEDADTLRWALGLHIAFSIDDRRFELQAGAQADAAVEVAHV